MKKLKIIHVIGRRSDMPKYAPLYLKMTEYQTQIDQITVHSGENYVKRLLGVFIENFDLPSPEHLLNIGAGTGVSRIAEMMIHLEPIIHKERPDLVMVYGVSDTALAAALVSGKCDVSLAHVGSGRCDAQPQHSREDNRKMIDALARFYFVTARQDIRLLVKEGVPQNHIHCVGNMLRDAIDLIQDKATARDILKEYHLMNGSECHSYGIVTFHRKENICDKKALTQLLDLVDVAQKDIRLIFPLHPKTTEALKRHGLELRLKKMKNVRVAPPLGYCDFIRLFQNAKFALTDSYAMQDEAVILSVPCLIFSKQTDRVLALRAGGNRLFDPESNSKDQLIRWIRMTPKLKPYIPRDWQENVAHTIIQCLLTPMADKSKKN